ncbi:zf-HC2 domain-containing protein [Paraburkholderia sp.]|jgi:anti-sigma factor RsiW|uniref:anti-sigma factor family protein n=1 Tax=Paraburkholderia sp. TaxID=1926495 RepID=UPI002F40A5C1
MNVDSILLMAYVDGELSPQECQEVEREIAVSPDVAELVAQLQRSRLPYAQAFARQKLPPVPDRLTQTIAAMAHEHAQQAAPLAANDAVLDHGASVPSSAPLHSRWRVAPAWLAVAFLAGVFCLGIGQYFLPQLVGPNVHPLTTPASANRGTSPWVAAAAGYQQLYGRDTVARLPVNAEASAQTVDEIRHEDGMNMRIPDLSQDGLTFKRVQRLRFHNQPLVQIVYLPAKGDPVALCVMKEAQPDAAIAGHHIDSMNVMTWRQAELSYALIGKPDEVDLSALARRISGSAAGNLFGDAGISREADAKHAAGVRS